MEADLNSAVKGRTFPIVLETLVCAGASELGEEFGEGVELVPVDLGDCFPNNLKHLHSEWRQPRNKGRRPAGSHQLISLEAV